MVGMSRSSGIWISLGRWADIVGIVSAAVGALVLVLSPSALAQSIMAGALAVLAIGSTVVAWKQSKQLYESADAVLAANRVAGSLPNFQKALDDFKNAYFSVNGERDDPDTLQFVQRCGAACEEAAAGFTELAGDTARVVLKEVYSVDVGTHQRMAVRTVASSDRDALVGFDSIDWVDENTDFELLRTSTAEVFDSNDLTRDLDGGYRNSHWSPDKLKEWKRTGEYPYRSTVVWPIRVKIHHEGAAIGGVQQTWSLAGFLSVDSKKPGVFNLEAVRPIGAGLASAAYTGLSRYRAIHADAESPQHEETK